MAEKLKSILKPIPWSLIFKSAVFGASYFFLPFWIFLFIALYLYFFPFFQSFRFILPFFTAIFLAFIWQPSFLIAVVLAAVFFLILGIKDLILIERVSAYEFLVYFLILMVLGSFFYYFSGWQKPSAVFWSLAVGFLIFFLIKGLADYQERIEKRNQKFLIIGLLSFLIWQLILILLFLPLNYFYETAVSFLTAFILIDFLFNYQRNDLGRKKILINFSVFLVLTAIILTSAEWSL